MTANSPRARKTKGQKFQKKIFKLLRNHFNIDNNIIDCFDGDVQAALMGQSGIDIKLSPKAKQLAEKYKAELYSKKIFTEIELSKPIRVYKHLMKKLNENINVLMFCFYGTAIVAFLFFFISIIVR